MAKVCLPSSCLEGELGNRRVICVSCVAFVVALLVIVPVVFVWNLFWNGQGSVNWIVSLGIAVVLAFLAPLAIAAKNASGHPR